LISAASVCSSSAVLMSAFSRINLRANGENGWKREGVR
jgi:hypothetical protein